MLSIGQVAREAGLRASTIRFYEKVGVIPMATRESGQRRYNSSIVRRLAVVEFAKECGFTLDEIRQVFSTENGAPLATQLGTAADRKIEQLEEQIKKFAAMKRLLEGARKCRCLDLDECSRRIMVHRGTPRRR